MLLTKEDPWLKNSLETTPTNRKRNKRNNIDKHWVKSTFQSVTNDLLLRFENRKKARKHWFVTLVTLENTLPGGRSLPSALWLRAVSLSFFRIRVY